MAFTEKVQQALSNQFNGELASAYIYLAMSAYFERRELPGCAHFMRIQAQEELLHATKIYSYMMDRNGKMRFDDVKAPKSNWKTPLEVFKDALEYEQETSERFNELAELCLKEKDHTTNGLVQQFLSEQVEEEAQFNLLVSKIKLIGDEASGMFIFDQELAARTFDAAAEMAKLGGSAA